MKKSKEQEGQCALCGEVRKLSFEHVPPQSAFNDKPILMQSHEHLFDDKSYLYGKKKKSPKGFGGYTLCVQCNNNTGDWYARDFADFAQQGMAIIKSYERLQYTIRGTYHIKPLNVIKQILTMFMSADKGGHLRSQKDLVSFILDRDSKALPERYKVFLYSTLSPIKRMMGYSAVYTPEHGVQKWSEINFQPFGYLLAEESAAAHEHMCNISSFGNFAYNEKRTVKITTAFLNVESPWIGDYK
ncbi:hypothetical protein EFA69_14645 [Rufibacter immobilis]|uniref:Uncharacterized protein n=1 Tax=Rufibacter immobilis TaxID=1348778 RepID=A0A3M9MQ87_9BACT|nr:hypothetical protein [Rufibacter immobilis]RNI27375.1 hypothetical protein EFA69_14645 [Rufibacter immobilis]